MMQLDALRKNVNSLKLAPAGKKKDKIPICFEFSKKRTCSLGVYCKHGHKYKAPPKIANYGVSELRLTDLGTKFLAEVRLFLEYGSVFSSASIKVVDVASSVLMGYEFILKHGRDESDGLFVISFDLYFQHIEGLLKAQEEYFSNLQKGKEIAEGENFYAEKVKSEQYSGICASLLTKFRGMLDGYRNSQRSDKNSLIGVSVGSHPDLVASLNFKIDDYYQRVCASMMSANVNNRQIISTLTSCLTNYFRDYFHPSIVPFGSAANQLGNIQYSDLDLSLTLLRYNANGVGLSEVPIVNDNIAIHRGKKRVAVLAQQVPPGGMRMSEVLKEVRNALYRYRQFEVKEVLSWARVPIIKMVHVPSNIEVDICIGNRLAVKNTDLLRQYAEFDTRAHKLMLTVKYWAASRKLNKARNGTLSSYAWVLLVIYFLQTVNVLPSFRITNRATLDVVGVHGVEFELLPLPAGAVKNTDTAAELLIKFFAFFGIQNAGDAGTENLNEYRSGFHAVSIRSGGGGGEKRVLLKTSKAVLELMNRSKKDKQQIGGNEDEDDEDEDVEEEGDSDSEGDDQQQQQPGREEDLAKNNESSDDANNDFLKEVDSDGEVVVPPIAPTAAAARSPVKKEKTPEELLRSLDMWYKFTIQDPFEEHDLGRVIQNPDIFCAMINELGRAAKTLLDYSQGKKGCDVSKAFDDLIGINSTAPSVPISTASPVPASVSSKSAASNTTGATPGKGRGRETQSAKTQEKKTATSAAASGAASTAASAMPSAVAPAAAETVVSATPASVGSAEAAELKKSVSRRIQKNLDFIEQRKLRRELKKELKDLEGAAEPAPKSLTRTGTVASTGIATAVSEDAARPAATSAYGFASVLASAGGDGAGKHVVSDDVERILQANSKKHDRSKPKPSPKPAVSISPSEPGAGGTPEGTPGATATISSAKNNSDKKKKQREKPNKQNTAFKVAETNGDVLAAQEVVKSPLAAVTAVVDAADASAKKNRSRRGRKDANGVSVDASDVAAGGALSSEIDGVIHKMELLAVESKKKPSPSKGPKQPKPDKQQQEQQINADASKATAEISDVTAIAAAVSAPLKSQRSKPSSKENKKRTEGPAAVVAN